MHFSYIVSDGKVVEWGVNRAGSPEKYFGYHSVAKLHSELNAYKKARGLLKGAHFELINVRINRLGIQKVSAPCLVCREWLASVGCERVYFTLNEEGWGRWEP